MQTITLTGTLRGAEVVVEYQQIGPRLTTVGLGWDYSDEESIEALIWAHPLVLWIMNRFARVAENVTFSEAVAERVQLCATDN